MPVYIPPNRNLAAATPDVTGTYTKVEADARFVHNFGNELINGTKIFANTPTFSNSITLLNTPSITACTVLTVNTSGKVVASSRSINSIPNLSDVQDITSNLSLEINNRINSDAYLQQQLNQISQSQYLVFTEQFTGNGSATQFNLTGNITNAQFVSGGWNVINIVNTLESDVTDVNGKPIYDAGILSYFTRHRIYVNSITSSGKVNLDYSPQNGQIFKVWYWYTLSDLDRIDNYYREDHVAKMEENSGDLATNIVTNTTNFNNILSSSDDTVQKALDTIDDKTILKTEVSNISGFLYSTTYNTSANLQSQIDNISASDVWYTPNISAYFYDTSNPKNLQIATDNLAKSHYFTRHTANRMTSTGLSYGGDLVGTIGTSSFGISGGYGYVVDQTILDTPGGINPKIMMLSWPDFSNISVSQFISAGYSATYVMITSAGQYYISPTEPSSRQIRDNIFLGKVSHRFGFVNNLRSYKRLPVEIYSNLSDLNEAIGPLNLNGNIYSAAGTNLNIQKTVGTSYRFSSNSVNNDKSPHITNDPALNPVTFRPSYRKLGVGINYGNSTTNIDPNYYDNGSGTLQTVSNNNWTVQRIFFFPVTNSTYVFYGQAEYSSIAAAKNAITSENFGFSDLDNSFSSATFRGWLIVKQGETDLSSTNTAFVAAGKYGSIAGGGGGVSNILNADYIAFNTNNIVPSFAEGQLYYDNAEKALALQTDVNGVTLQIGQEQYVRVLNNTGTTIYNGTVVYVNGAVSDRPTVDRAIANNESYSDRVIGVATHDITDGDLGYVTINGLVHDMDTSGFTAGQIAYLSSTVAGNITGNRPIAPNHGVVIGQVLRANPTQGILYVNPQIGYEINELHDVYFPYSLQDGQLLTYSISGNRWENTTNINNLVTLNTTQIISGNKTFSQPITLTNGTTAQFYTSTISQTAPFNNILVDQFSVGPFNGCNWDIVVKDSANLRISNVMAGWIGSNSTYTETTAPDIGDTSSVYLNVSLISGGTYAALQASAIGSSTWTIKALRKCL